MRIHTPALCRNHLLNYPGNSTLLLPITLAYPGWQVLYPLASAASLAAAASVEHVNYMVSHLRSYVRSLLQLAL